MVNKTMNTYIHNKKKRISWIFMHVSHMFLIYSILTMILFLLINSQSLWSAYMQVVIDSRFFTMLAVAGTLLGSVLCFLEVNILFFVSTRKLIYSNKNVSNLMFFFLYHFQGCFIILESYLQYLQALSHGSGSDHGHHMVQLLIEAMGT